MGEISFNFPDQFQWGRNPSTFQTNSNGVDIIYWKKKNISNDMSSLIEKNKQKSNGSYITFVTGCSIYYEGLGTDGL
jgi:hypothetical protein